MTRPTVLHVTTTDISLELLLGPQLRAFQAAGYDVVTASAAGPFVEKLEADGIVHHGLQHATRSMNLMADLRALRELHALFRKVRPAIVHTHNPKPGVYGRLAAKAARVPVVVNTVHGLYATENDSRKKRLAVYGLERLAATCSDAELIQNPEDVETLRKLRIPDHKLHLLGNGVDLARFSSSGDPATRAALRSEFGIASDELVVGVVGRLVWEKGYGEVFAAAAKIRETNPNVRFLVIGPHEPDKADSVTPDAIADAEANGVIFAGHRSDVEDLYEAMDVYVLASYREGFPRSAMEAAAMGLPIVTTDVRGCRQVVDHDVTGIIVPVRDADALTTGIEVLVTDGELRRIYGEAGRAKAKAEFDQQRVIDITLDTYRRLSND